MEETGPDDGTEANERSTSVMGVVGELVAAAVDGREFLLPKPHASLHSHRILTSIRLRAKIQELLAGHTKEPEAVDEEDALDRTAKVNFYFLSFTWYETTFLCYSTSVSLIYDNCGYEFLLLIISLCYCLGNRECTASQNYGSR